MLRYNPVVNPGSQTSQITIGIADTSNFYALSALYLTGGYTQTLWNGISPFFQPFSLIFAYPGSSYTPRGGVLGYQPRVYLALGTQGVEITSVVLQNGTISGTIPPGVPPGTYDLFVVNQNGEVARRTSAIVVSASSPPSISRIIPSAFTSTNLQSATIRGSNFVSGLTVTAKCKANFTLSPFVLASVGVNIFSSTSLTVTFNFSSIAAGAICLIEVTNSDGQSGSSTVSVRNGASVSGWDSLSQTLVENRRGLTLLSATLSDGSRYLYAIGGDLGSSNNAKRTTEYCGLDAWGNPSSFARLSTQLPGSVTLSSGVTINNFLYLAGGVRNSVSQSNLFRAKVLDPSDTVPSPRGQLELASGTSNIVPGLYLYQVSVIYNGADAFNPNGESLPSRIIPVQVPQVAFPGVRWRIALTWPAISGASSYKIYRSYSAGAIAANVYYLTTVFTNSFQDTATLGVSLVRPLSVGMLGEWTQFATMNTARDSHSTVVVPHPSNSLLSVLYTLGGLNSGSALNSYEYIVLNTSRSDQPIVANFATRTLPIPAIYEASAMTVTNDDTSYVTGSQSFIYIPGGKTTGGTYVSTVYALTGSPLDLSTSFSCSGSNCALSSLRSGYCAVQARANLYVFGGGLDTGNAALATGEQSTLPNLGGGTSAPVTNAFVATSDNYLVGRKFHSCTATKGLIFAAGGTNNQGTIYNTVEVTVQ